MKPITIWLTGMPCSGKTTIAKRLIETYKSYDTYLADFRVVSLDGDDLRDKLNSDLGFSPEDRKENLRRVGHLAQLFNDKNICTVCSFVSPTEELREEALDKIERCILVYVKCSAETCAERDVKGMWAKAKAGEIKMFTGYSAPFDDPQHADLVLNTEASTVDDCVYEILSAVGKKFDF